MGVEKEEKIVGEIDSGRRSDEAWLNGISKSSCQPNVSLHYTGIPTAL